jgi:hypothetical protein
MKTLLEVTAFVDVGTGLGLLCCPSAVTGWLLRSPLYAPASVTLGRVTGAALLTMDIACWLAVGDSQSRAARGLIAAMLLYNIAIVALLAFAGIPLHLVGLVLGPAAVLHAVMAVRCFASLISSSREAPQLRAMPK